MKKCQELRVIKAVERTFTKLWHAVDGSNGEEGMLYFNIQGCFKTLSLGLAIQMANRIHTVESTHLLSYASHTHYLFITAPNRVRVKLMSAMASADKAIHKATDRGPRFTLYYQLEFTI